MAEQDDRYEELDKKAKEVANDIWRRALATGQDIDTFIAQARECGERATREGNQELQFYFESLEYILDNGQRLRDAVSCMGIEREEQLGQVWPADYAQQLDAAPGDAGMGW